MHQNTPGTTEHNGPSYRGNDPRLAPPTLLVLAAAENCVAAMYPSASWGGRTGGRHQVGPPFHSTYIRHHFFANLHRSTHTLLDLSATMAGLRAALAVLLAARQLTVGGATTFVCGGDYTDASQNCTANPGCPTGDGCPPEQPICFAMPDDQCFGPPTVPEPTAKPTAGPTPEPLQVCGTSLADATSGCKSNAACPEGDGRRCPVGAACFSVPVDQCLTEAPSPQPTSVPKVCGADFAAAEANCLDLSKRCPSGQGCATGEACFSVPPGRCGVATPTTPGPTTAAPVVASVPAEPTVSPTAAAVPAEPTTAPAVSAPADPTASPAQSSLKVCGTNYTDVTANCRTNPGCPTGDVSALPDCPLLVVHMMCSFPLPLYVSLIRTAYALIKSQGCPMGMTCFALPPSACPEPVPTASPVTTPPTVPATAGPTAAVPAGTSPPTNATGTVSPTVSVAPSAAVVSPTAKPTASPVYNRFFCGATYNDAEANCVTAQPCPSGFATDCDEPGAACFGITAERCLSGAPTGAPTGAGPQPSISPTVSSAPTGETRVPSAAPTKVPTENVFYCGMTFELAQSNCSEETACPTGAGCPGGMLCYNGITCSAQTTAPSPAPTPTMQGIFGTGAPTKKPTLPVFEKYCGFSVDDAASNCETAVACPDGLSSVCPSGQTCFPIPEACWRPVDPDAPTPTDAPIAFDVSSPNFCGADFNDALDNCYQRTPCPTGFADECPGEQGCYPVSECVAPEPATSPSPTMAGGSGANATTMGPTPGPVTVKPTWGDFEFPEGPSASCRAGSGLLVRSMVLAGVAMAALVM